MSIDPAPLPDEWLIELGRLTQEWAAFEQWLNLMIQKLAGYNDPFDGTFSILVVHSSFPQRLDMFASLCERAAAEHSHLDGYKIVIAMIREAQTLRNRFAHNVIGMEVTSSGPIAKIATISARGKLKKELKVVTLAEISKARAVIREAVHASYRLVLNADPEAGG